jgi:hypothetical protein
VYDVDVSGVASKQRVALQLSNLLLMQPLQVQNLSGLQSVDLPFHGNVRVGAADVATMPYVGIVNLVGVLDTSNVNIQPWSGKGFIVRGAVSETRRQAFWWLWHATLCLLPLQPQ